VILLTTKRADLRHLGSAIAIVAPGYEPPIGPEVVPLGAVLDDPAAFLEGGRTLVAVGLSQIMTPSNRVKLGQVFLRPRVGLRRIVIDRHLFVAEPWRMWWPFRCAGKDQPWGLTDSFLAESRWKAAIELQTPDPFGWEPLQDEMRGVVHVEDAFAFGHVEVRTVPVGGNVHDAYAAEKEAAFSSEKTTAGILGRLSRFAQRACPERCVPTASQLFKQPPSTIVATDLAVDRFLVGQLVDRMTLTNWIASAS